MKKSDYIAHCRRMMLQSAMNHIAQIPDEEIIESSVEHAAHHGVNMTMSDILQTIDECTSPQEVDKIIGCTGHGEDTLAEMDDEVIDDYKNMSPQEVEENFNEMFAELMIDFAQVVPDVDIILSYSFVDNKNESRGSTMIVGHESILNILIEECESVIENVKDDDGFVNTFIEPLSSEEIHDENLLREIENGNSSESKSN